MTLGSVFSGTDVVSRVIGKLSDVWDMPHDCFRMLFQCEKDAAKQAWLLSQFPDVPHLFEDADRLCEAKVWDIRTGAHVHPPRTMGLIAGFACTSRSRLNIHAQQFKGCITSGEGATGSTFRMVLRYLVKKQPDFVVLENVTDLASAGAAGEASDAEQVIQELATNGYTSNYFVIDARKYGSAARRLRLYWIAYPTTPFAMQRLQFAKTVLQEMQLDEALAHAVDFLLPETALDCNSQPSSEGSAPAAVHADAFLERGYDWPLTNDELVRVVGSDLRGLTQRAKEVVYLVAQEHLMPPDAKVRVAGGGGHSRAGVRPWIPTPTPSPD